MRYFLKLSYRGMPFHGWQTQPNAVSVQQTIENALSTVLRAPVPITGAGRTDAGVNARVMYAHFDVPSPIEDDRLFIYRLNSLTGKDIVIERLILVHNDAHARFDATSRTYRYLAHDFRSPFLYDRSWQTPYGLDYELMNRAAAMLTEVEDFTSFAKLHSDSKTNICHVTRAEWIDLPDPGCHAFEITADRFLRNMVRAVVGTLVEVGRHKLSLDGFREVIEAHNRCEAGTSMPGHALYLWDVTYPYIK